MFISVDPLADKYPGISGYAYCANNPLKYVDDDGMEIKLVNFTKYSANGNYLGKTGAVSRKTENALTDMLKTKEGYAYLSQFAKKGDKIGDFEFKTDGDLSNHTLEIRDYSLADEHGQILPTKNQGAYNTETTNGKTTVTIKVFSNGRNKNDIGEILSHEMLLHGFNIREEIKTGIKTSGTADHKALKEKNTKHSGYQRYYNIRGQLIDTDKNYDKSFKKAEEHAEKNY